MSKILVFLVMFSLMSVFGAIGVLATSTSTQPAQFTVTADLTLTPTPSLLDFGIITPGSSPTATVTLIPGTSDLSVSVGITGNEVIKAMQYDTGSGYVGLDGKSFIITHGINMVFPAKITVPVGTKANIYSGTITYTVNEAV